MSVTVVASSRAPAELHLWPIVTCPALAISSSTAEPATVLSFISIPTLQVDRLSSPLPLVTLYSSAAKQKAMAPAP